MDIENTRTDILKEADELINGERQANAILTDELETYHAALPRAYRMGLEDAATVMDHRAYGCRITVGMDPQGQCEGGAEDIRAIPTPTDLVERAMKKTGQ